MVQAKVVEKQWFHFKLEGDGKRVPLGDIEAEDEEEALKLARKQCHSLQLPGWLLVCEETGHSFPAVAFLDRKTAGKPVKTFL